MQFLDHTYHLKSSMDRFIDYAYGIDKDVEKDLKSSMDRFIVRPGFPLRADIKNLKSSMDRFIASSLIKANV